MEESKNKKPSGRRPERDSVNPDEFLRIALKRFARQGYGGLTLNGLAKETGVTDSLLHYHFGGKEELW